MAPDSSASWHAIAAQPAIGVAATVCAYSLAVRINRACGGNPLANPTLVAIVMLAVGIKVVGLDYASYAQSAAYLSFMLSPAVVLLAVPLFRQRRLVQESGSIIVGALAVGLPTGVGTAVGIAWLLGADWRTLLSLAPKSTTAGISEKIGAIPALTAVLVIMTGIVGAVCGPYAMRRLGINDPRAVGLGMGISAHGIGTARALQIGEVTGAFAGLGMGLNGIMTAIVLPIAANCF